MAVRRTTRGRTARTHLTAKKAAIRMNTIFDMLKAGKTPKQIKEKLRVPYSTFRQDLIVLREANYRKGLPEFIPPKGVMNWDRVKVRRVKNVIAYATAIIEERIPARKRKRKGPAPVSSLTIEDRKTIAALRKDAFRSNVAIAKETGNPIHIVGKRRRELVEQGLIPEVTRSEIQKTSQRKPERITGVLDEKTRHGIIEKNKRTIESVARHLYRTNQVAFDGTNVLPERIPEEIEERMRWKLKTYEPKKWNGSVDNFFSSALTIIKFDIKRQAWRKYRAMESLEAGMEEQKDRKRTLEALPVFQEATIEKMEVICEQLNLDILEKAILFGRRAGLVDQTIANATGYQKTRIQQIRVALEKRVKKLLSE